jgi:hypothetical protein
MNLPISVDILVTMVERPLFRTQMRPWKSQKAGTMRKPCFGVGWMEKAMHSTGDVSVTDQAN